MAKDGNSEDAPEGYTNLTARYGRVVALEDAAGLLNWDQQVMMPEEGTAARSRQLSALSATSHELLTDADVGDWLAAVHDDITGDRAAIVREIRRRYERSAPVPSDLVEDISAAASEALPVWEAARADDDFASFAPNLERLVALKREYANHVDPSADPYEVLFRDFEPYLSLETAERILGRLRDELIPLLEAISHSDEDLATAAFDGSFAVDVQEQLARDVVDLLGFDWDRGRLDTSTHPFTSGTPHDVRITTRFDEREPLDALTAAIHEFGHATYTLGLPRDAYGTPLGQDRGLTVHESQSRLWENHVGRSRAFWTLMVPHVRDRFPSLADLTPRQAFEAANQVHDDSLIRVEADELTYHLHIILRFEIERDLVSGDLDVAEVPAVWNDRMDQYLGVRPDSDATGCLQDIHWSQGSFGYFPTYTLGSVLAAQLFAAADGSLPLDEQITAGDFTPLHDWLGEHIHRHGCRYPTPDLIESATGDPLAADAFLEYVTEKYERLYDL